MTTQGALAIYASAPIRGLSSNGTENLHKEPAGCFPTNPGLLKSGNGEQKAISAVRFLCIKPFTNLRAANLVGMQVSGKALEIARFCKLALQGLRLLAWGPNVRESALPDGFLV